MEEDSGIRQSVGLVRGQRARFSAWQWERRVADEFLRWRSTSGVGLQLMRTFAAAVSQTLNNDAQQFIQSGELASKLMPVLTSCDHLTFDDRVEALAYSGLHLLDRYGRVSQVLEYLMRVGRLPLRLAGVHVLEIGAGPAPALYATRDFYDALVRWPGRGEVLSGPLRLSDTLDRGRAWDPFLHHLSENLLTIRGGAWSDAYLASGRTIHDFTGFDVWQRHHQSVKRSAERLVDEFIEDGDFISDARARQMAYQNGVLEPSAYDIMVLCNFLTQQSMAEIFEVELRRLAFSLTPGGVLIVIGATSGGYPAIYSKLRTIAATAKLSDISPKEVFQSNAEPRLLSLVADHIRENVRFALNNCPTQMRSEIKEALPKELVDDKLPFKLPKFQVLIFVRQGPRRGKKQMR